MPVLDPGAQEKAPLKKYEILYQQDTLLATFGQTESPVKSRASAQF
jgi:hypothetical protein